MTDRVRITLTERTAQMVDWFVNNDPQFLGGPRSDVINMLLERGVDVVYREGLRNAAPLDPGLAEQLTVLSVDNLVEALGDEHGE